LHGVIRMPGMTATAAVVGSVLSILGTGLYLRDVRRGRTRPHRGSWLVWGVIAVIAALSHGACGGGWSLLVLWGQAAGTLAVLCAAIRTGTGWITPSNLVMLAIAALGILGWITLTDPTAASACAAIADGTGLIVLLPKVWADPGSETLSTYALAGTTGLLTCLAVAEWDPRLLLFPVYFCLGNAATAAFIAARRRRLAVARSRPDLTGPISATRTRRSRRTRTGSSRRGPGPGCRSVAAGRVRSG
jgi:hypothetical protein